VRRAKRLLERCGTGKGYLNETLSGSFRPPGLHIKRAEARTKGTRSRIGPGCPAGHRKNGNVLSATESQGLRETKGFGPELTETGAISFGKCAPEPEGHFVLESPAVRREQKDSRKVLL
jgi:hypothetical protein